MISLVRNEMLKIVRKKRILIVAGIIAVLVALFTYSQYREIERRLERFGDVDWRTTLQQQIIDTQNRITSSGISDEWKSELLLRIQQQQYYLDKNVNPMEPGAPSFARMFAEHSINLFLPLMIMVVAADIVSSERTAGTVKLLLTRPVKRWKILMSKYIALILSVSIIVVLFGVLSYLISGLIFGYQGWSASVITGFSVEGNELNTNAVQMIPQWQYLLMEFSLVWFVALIVGTITFMLSVLIRNTPAGMGVMLAALISGAILSNMVSSWESAKYLFMINLNLTGYLSGQAPPIEGMSLGFSLVVLAVWGLAALIVSFGVFIRQDIY
ncbi:MULTISPECIES: ABC transporter permease [unclassified Mesobacillus]|uniref:ABC transporter permease n=1 Tax=unclassified Mesobacillus TaxID=2675270 RepID=UPI00203C62DB|nr:MULTISPECIES: ABC transporter permease [unclassified Mesobacillus]MCM3123053.1 ABC transporter permease [Mesobacillus sp. MER 33]MCM3233464.1 ABC transporter permease [Mesobacillus sp. MER 48]